MTSFAQRITRDKNSQNLFLVTGGKDASGRAAWYYVQVEPHLRLKFEKAIKSGAMTITEFGTIIDSGYGKTPPEAVREHMKREYGFEG